MALGLTWIAFSRPHQNAKKMEIRLGNTIAPVTGHALYDVWHHRIRKPPFLPFHTKTISWPFQKNSLWRPFSETYFFFFSFSAAGGGGGVPENAFIGQYNKNARNAIERCAPSGPQKHTTKESGFHNHSTPLTMFARLPHWYARNMLATRQSWATSVTWVVYEGNKDKTANFHFPF